jgi:hypothetical protein
LPEVYSVGRALITNVSLNRDRVFRCLKDAGPFLFDPPTIAVPGKNYEIMETEVNVGQVRLFVIDGNPIEGDNAAMLIHQILENPCIKNSYLFKLSSLDDGMALGEWFNKQQKRGEVYRIPEKQELLESTHLIDRLTQGLPDRISLEDAAEKGLRYTIPGTPILFASRLQGWNHEWTKTERIVHGKHTDRYYLCSRRSSTDKHEHRGTRQDGFALRFLKEKKVAKK